MNKVTLRPTQLNKGKFTASEKAELIKKQWHVEYHLNGKRCTDRGDKNPINRIKNFDERYEAIKVMEAGVILAFESGAVKNLDYQNLTVEEACDMYIANCKEYKDNIFTIEAYKSKLKYLIAEMGYKAIKEVSKKEAKNFLDKIAKKNKWKPVTVNNAINVYKGLFNWLDEQEYTEMNPFKIKAVKKTATAIHKVFKTRDLKALMNSIQDDAMVLLFVKTLYYTSIRPSEICGLKVKDVDMDRQQIIIPASIAKNNDEGIVNMDAELFKEFEKLNLDNFHRNDYLFTREPSIVGKNKINRNFVTRIIRDKLQSLGMYDDTGYTLYGFKHTANCQRIIDGWNMIDIMMVNRHGSISTTEKYCVDLRRVYNLNREDDTQPILPITKPQYRA